MHETTKSANARAITIIGAGIVGIACAIHLQRDGHRVTVVDRLPPGEGTSSGNAGVMASSAVVPIAIPGIVWKAPKMLLDPLGPLSFRWRHLPRLLPWMVNFIRNSSPERVEQIADALASLLGTSVQEHQALAAGTGAEPWVRPSPYLYVYENEAAFKQDAYAWRLRQQRGGKIEILKGPEVQEFEPALSPNQQYGVVLQKHGYSPDPLQLVKALAAHFVRSGGTLLRREVKDINIGTDGPNRLLTDAGALDLDTLVIAAGAWSGRLTARLGNPVPLESERGYHITLRNAGVMPRYPIMSASGKFVSTPMTPGLRLAGLVEFGGLSRPPRYARARTLLTHAQRLFPGVQINDYSEWMGHRPSLPDSLPIIDRSSQFPSVFYAFGHQHIGITSGPLTGRLIADLVAGRQPSIDLTPFRVSRF